MVCDPGLPIPSGPAVVELAFRFGVPSGESVLSGILEIEGATAAEEVEENPDVRELL